MRVGLRMLQPGTVRWLREELQQGQLSRAELARELCRRDGWRNPKGKLCAASARKALPRLAAALQRPLPPPVRGCARAGPANKAADRPPVTGPLPSLGAVRLRLAGTEADKARCRDLLDQAHPLGRGRAPGWRLTYSLECESAGVLGVLSFVAAPLRLAPRDNRLGWSERARGTGVQRIVSQDRFLILAHVRVPNLASKALDLAARQLPADWSARHGVEPLLLETCVDANRAGTCYRSAGWECAGRTKGRPPGSASPAAPKSVWLKGLADGWEQRLRAEPERPLGAFPALEPDDDAGWSAREFLRSDLPDGRLRERLLTLGARWERSPGAPVPAIFPQRAERKAAYRFLHNARVAADDILQPHREAMLERCRQQEAVLLVQDTTTVNYSGLAGSARGLGPLLSRQDRARGLWLHAAVVFGAGGRPLGVSGLEVWARPEREPERDKESARWLRGQAQAQELGRAAPGTRVVAAGGRESDIFELFRRQAASPQEAGLLVRSNAGRQRKVKVFDEFLNSWMVRPLEACMDFVPPVVEGHAVQAGSRGGPCGHARPDRKAVTELRIARVQLQPPLARPGLAALDAIAVQVRETHLPRGREPLEWLLLSSEGEPTAEWARRLVAWYECCRGIEECFRMLKSGARVEDRRLRDRDALAKCLALDAITAWRVFELQRYARAAPRTPAAEVLTRDEMAVLAGVTAVEGLRPLQVPLPEDIRNWVRLLASIVGWQPSKRRPLPGNEVLWRANCLLQAMIRGYRASPPP